MDTTKKYTGLQKAIRQADALVKKQGLDVLDGIELLATMLEVSRKTVRNWLRQDGIKDTAAKPVADNAIGRAVAAHGGPAVVARMLGVTHQAVTQWIAQGYVPVKRVAEFEIQFGVPRAQLFSPKVRSAMGEGGEL